MLMMALHKLRVVKWSAYLLVTFVSPAKTAELIEMPFGILTRVSRENHILV